MGLTEEILFFLSNNPGNYGQLRSRMLGDPFLEEKLVEKAERRKAESAKEKTLRVTLSKLKKKGLIKNDNHHWQLTPIGLKKFKSHYLYRQHSFSPLTTKTKQKMIIAFDIPEEKRRGRNWLRIELVGLGFKMLQKSVWLGPAPLPEEFISHLKIMEILPHLKFFEVQEADII